MWLQSFQPLYKTFHLHHSLMSKRLHSIVSLVIIKLCWSVRANHTAAVNLYLILICHVCNSIPLPNTLPPSGPADDSSASLIKDLRRLWALVLSAGLRHVNYFTAHTSIMKKKEKEWTRVNKSSNKFNIRK